MSGVGLTRLRRLLVALIAVWALFAPMTPAIGRELVDEAESLYAADDLARHDVVDDVDHDRAELATEAEVEPNAEEEAPHERKLRARDVLWTRPLDDARAHPVRAGPSLRQTDASPELPSPADRVWSVGLSERGPPKSA